MFDLKYLLKKIFPSKFLKEEDTGKNESEKIQQYDVFISKKTEDHKMAEEVCAFLESNGFRCFISERDLPNIGNTNYYQIIDKALENSTNMVVICSRAEYLKSKWVQHEWQTFSNELLSSHRQGNIITLRSVNVCRNDIPYTLRNLELIDWTDYKSRLLAYIVKPNIKSNPPSKTSLLIDSTINMKYSDAFKLGLRIGKYGLASVGNTATSNDVNEIKTLLSEWDLNDEKVDPLLHPGKGMDFLNSIIDIIGERWGNIYENSVYLGTTYIFCALSKNGGDATLWNQKVVEACQKIGIPQHIFLHINQIDADGMVAFRDALLQALDNIDNSVTKCKCCGARIGFDYQKCPICSFSIT